jgi:transcriptional regulator with GAF, ATPase, and Fis domain
MDTVISMPLRSFAEVQREGILRTLERTGWRVSGPKGAAAVLRLKPTTLESKMKKLGIRRPPR